MKRAPKVTRVFRLKVDLAEQLTKRSEVTGMTATRILENAALLGSMTSKAKKRASKANGKLGGWPKGRKRKPSNDTKKVLVKS